MKFFSKRQASEQKHKCPNCGAELELDIVRGLGKCPYCGTTCNISRSDMGVVDSVISFIERQQERADQKRQREEEEKRRKELEKKEHYRKYGWLYGLAFAIVIVAVVVIVVTTC